MILPRAILRSGFTCGLAYACACAGEPLEQAAGAETEAQASDDDASACGNGQVDPGETCDDANDDNLDGCTIACQLGPRDVTLVGMRDAGVVGEAAITSIVDDLCPDRQLVVGLAGHIADGGWLSQVGVECGVVGLADSAAPALQVEPGDSLPPRGATGNVQWSRRCAMGEAVVGLGARRGDQITQVTLECAAISLRLVDDGWLVELAQSHPLQGAGGDIGEPTAPIVCPPGWVATGGRISAGESVEALGLRCGEILVQ